MTSVLNSSSQTAHQVKRPDKSTHSLKPGGLSADGSGEFGSLFGALMTGMPGQDLAAQAAADGKLSPKAAGLASEVLGPSVHIITSAEPAISDDSLLAFARTQGMDEEALTMIFGRKLAQAAEAAGGEPSAADVMAAASLRSRAGLSGVSGADAAQAPGNTVDLGDAARISWQLGEAAQNGSKPSAEPLQSTMFGLNGVRSLLSEGNAKTAKLEQAAHPEAPNQSLAASLILGAAEASQFARRMQMKQATQRAEKLADALPLSSLATATPDAGNPELPVETLTIDTDLPDGDLQLMLQQRQPEGGNAGGNDDGMAGPASQATQRSDSGERAEQYEKLSQRLGEALGQRLAAQIAKGDWKVEMALRPLDLGKVDIELRMNQGELQASFHASEAATRDLITNGLPKLKEVLAQLGMEVANVDVNVRQDSQSGGNPTPGKPSPGIAGIGTKRRDGEAVATGELPATRSVKASDDGLDLLV